MSADNGIYILETKAPGTGKGIEYRVSHVGAIDNYDYYKQRSQDAFLNYLKTTWGKSEVYDNAQDALMKANELYNEYPIVEYGISSIKEHNMVFPN